MTVAIRATAREAADLCRFGYPLEDAVDMACDNVRMGRPMSKVIERLSPVERERVYNMASELVE